MLAVINGCDQVTTQVTGAVMILGLPEMFYVSRAQKPEKVGNPFVNPIFHKPTLNVMMEKSRTAKRVETL